MASLSISRPGAHTKPAPLSEDELEDELVVALKRHAWRLASAARTKYGIKGVVVTDSPEQVVVRVGRVRVIAAEHGGRFFFRATHDDRRGALDTSSIKEMVHFMDVMN